MILSLDKTLFIFLSHDILKDNIPKKLIKNTENYVGVILEDFSPDGWSSNFKFISDFYDLGQLRREVDEITESTLRSITQDSALMSMFTVDGISILKVIREDFGFILTDIIKKVLIIERIIAKEAPARIVVFEKYSFLEASLPIRVSAIVSIVAEKYSIPFHSYSSKYLKFEIQAKKVMTPLFYLIKNVKIYNIVKIKSRLLNRSLKAKIGSKIILFIPYSDAEKVSMMPLVERLSCVKKVTCVAVPYPQDDEHVGLFETHWKNSHNSIITYSFGEFYPTTSIDVARKYNEILTVWQRRKQFFYSSKAFNVSDGINISKIMSEKFEVLFKCWIKDFARYFVVTGKLLKKQKPSIIVTAKERWLFIRSVLEAVQQEGIPTVLIQHGICYDHWQESDSINVTKICVDETYRDMLIKGGEKSEKIMVTGAPRYDSLFRKIGNDKDFFRMRLHLKPKQKYVCLLTSFVPEWNTPEHRLNLLRAVFQSLEKTDFDLLIKLHPREDIKEIQNLIKAISADNRMNQRAKIIDFANVDLFDVILASDIVVSVRTSAVISALLAKKPLILIQYDSSLTEFFPDIEMSIFGVAKSNNDLLYLITKAITNSSLAEASTAKGLEYARRYVPYENATDRVVNCIMELLDKN